MCTVSMVLDDRFNKWPIMLDPISIPVSRVEFDKLRKEVEELKELIKAAQKFDEATGQPNCEDAEKMEKLRKIAEILGVEI